MRHNVKLLTIIAAFVLILTPACALGDLIATEPVPPPTPSITPKPTFTATPPETPTPIVAPSNTPTLAPTPTFTPAEPTATDTPAEPTPTFTPEASPTSEGARLIIDNPTLNVRRGPGTNYGILGQARDGERYDVTGRNAQSSWWQIDYNGQDGWVSGSYVILEGDPGAVAVAANIPAPPPTATPVPPPPTQPPPPAEPTQPPAPQFPYSYVNGSTESAPNCGAVYLKAKVVDSGGNPVNGVTVMLEFFGNRVFRVTGVNESTGQVGFTPLSRDLYRSPVPFNIRLVESESNPSPISDNHFIDFQDCDGAGQFTNITFRRN
jgi:hypothetical protein